MQIETKFSNGDTVYAVGPGGVYNGPFLVGKVQVEIVDSPGIPGEEFFDNFKSQKNYREQYMLVETGIGSGTCYLAENLYANLDDAAKAQFVPYY